MAQLALSADLGIWHPENLTFAWKCGNALFGRKTTFRCRLHSVFCGIIKFSGMSRYRVPVMVLQRNSKRQKRICNIQHKSHDSETIPPTIMWTAHFPIFSVRLSRDRSDVTTKIAHSNRVQSSSNTSLSPSNPDHMSSQDSPCGNWPICQLWWLKTREVRRVLDAIHYATLCMLVFRAIRIHQFVQYRLHQLPRAKDETPHLFNGFITNSWLATLPTMPHRTPSFSKALWYSQIKCLLQAFLTKQLQNILLNLSCRFFKFLTQHSALSVLL